MEFGEKLKELNLTAYEVDRFTKAFKDEKFREMLRDYTQEILDPENRKMYEEEIKILEQERGNTVEFIHPEPFRAIKTSVDGKQKCFINICASDKVGKPSSKWVVSENGRRGQCWSLPHSLHPGRQDTDPKGNKMMIYDVVFHPDTTRMASKNKSFLEMVDSIAIQGIQDTFKVTLDKKNTREMKTKYKGTPQPCVIRKAIPGFKAKESSDSPDPLAFPYPDEKRPSTQSKPTEAPSTTKNSTDSKPQSLLKTREPTKPNYTVKYRSLIDLQDFRCSRDSAQSPRPKEIVVTVDLPLLKSVKDTSLEVKEKKLLLETKKPAYRLELHLAYPVDEDKGEAKFNKQRGQLIVTLPVLSHNLPPDLFEGPAMANHKSPSCDESEEDKSEVEEEDKQKKREGEKREPELQKGAELKEERQTENAMQENGGENSEKEEDGVQEKGEEQIREEAIGADEAKWKKGQEYVEEETVAEGHKGRKAQEEHKLKEEKQWAKQSNQNEDEKSSEGGRDRAAEDDDTLCEASALKRGPVADDRGLVTENQHILISAEQSHGAIREEDVNLASSLEEASKMKPSDIQEKTEKKKANVAGKAQVEQDAAFQNQTSSDEARKTAMDECDTSERVVKSKDTRPTRNVKTSSGGESGQRVTFCSEDVTVGSAKQEMDEDDLQMEQISPVLQRNKPPPVLLREIDKDGNEIVISDHTSSAGFTFLNTLMYELD
ncbi:protein kintoun [Neolamprologus brichardi]|uniref:protein kintoun n=1 Tax=Neolamprologus brichardi TaxID=32507 RepID=UPI0003EBFDA7|nr:protein kintoun [Neolamprologus brichardi]